MDISKVRTHRQAHARGVHRLLTRGQSLVPSIRFHLIEASDCVPAGRPESHELVRSDGGHHHRAAFHLLGQPTAAAGIASLAILSPCSELTVAFHDHSPKHDVLAFEDLDLDHLLAAFPTGSPLVQSADEAQPQPPPEPDKNIGTNGIREAKQKNCKERQEGGKKQESTGRIAEEGGHVVQVTRRFTREKFLTCLRSLRR